MSHVPEARKNDIEKTVERVRLDTGLSYPKDSLVEIADRLGAKVVSAKLPDFKDKKVKGYIKWFSDGELEEKAPYRAQIYLNSDQSDTTKTFTLAHELGHFLLHKGSNNFRIDLEDYSPSSDPKNEETEANCFAGSLLMPEDLFLTALNNSESLDDVARAFGVSTPAVEARMKWLHIKLA